ncbi:hypothetical protein [Aliiroseovarius sp.]|uniref:hypothetical protein n=1 Tax=Aliiroseovarius sp. TaxID=1872442 RepID=UPI00260D22F6|nr:hypothetical protein [Aliiroseovarius sp.]
MSIEVIVIMVVAVAVLGIFGNGARRRRKRDDEGTRIVIVNNDEDIRIETGQSDDKPRGGSVFAKLLTMIVSLAAGFAAAGFVIVNFLEPNMGPIDPFEPLAVLLYLVFGLIIYGIIRAFARR